MVADGEGEIVTLNSDEGDFRTDDCTIDGIVIEDITATGCRREPGGHGGLIWFQEGVQDVGSVTIRRLRREESHPRWNGIHTIDIGANAVIRDLRLEDVSQKLPGDPPFVRRDPSARAAVRREAP